MMSNPSAGCRQHYLPAIFLLVCLTGIFFTYYKPTMSWWTCSVAPVSTHSKDDCTRECLKTVEMLNCTKCPNNSLEFQQTAVSQPEATKEKQEPTTTMVLIWPWPFGFRFEADVCLQLEIKGCYLTDDRTQYEKAHAVMFHHREISGDLPKLLKMPRPPGQKWAWLNMESPENSNPLSGADDLFNLTVNYRRDSDIQVPYGRIVQASEKDRAFKIPPKDKLVCWIVSNWKNHFRRVSYFNELIKHITVEAYGKPFKRKINDTNYNKIVSSCKFYLSFENSIYKDYFTEKLFNPLKLGTVPVVLGSNRENYEEFIPADSFIHVDDFETPQELAERLKFLDQNQEMYERYFTWRKDYVAESGSFVVNSACNICDHVRRYKSYRIFKNLNHWYWG